MKIGSFENIDMLLSADIVPLDVKAVAKVAEKSIHPFAALVVPQEHRTFSGTDAQLSILIGLFGGLPEAANRKFLVEHPQTETVSSLDDENIVHAL
jgi:hypothetical protein